MKVPIQSPPVHRGLLNDRRNLGRAEVIGVEAAQSACDHLTGMARQICYALEYGVSI